MTASTPNPDPFHLSPTELNRRAARLCSSLFEQPELAHELDVHTSHGTGGCRLLDFGADRCGTIAGGLLLARICLAELATVNLVSAPESSCGLPRIQVRTDHPLAACVASQYAGWPFSVGEYFAMCSGPARMCRGKEELLESYGCVGPAPQAVAIFESSRLPGEEEFAELAAECNVELENVHLCVARTASLPGTIQIVARSVETTLHKLHEIGFDLQQVRNAVGSAPLPPIAGDDLTALGWTNDAILYGTHVNLWVESEDELIKRLGPKIPSNSSVDYGRPFLEIFNQYNQDFYQVDKLLFSPAQVQIHNLATGRSFLFGAIRNDLLISSFGLDK